MVVPMLFRGIVKDGMLDPESPFGPDSHETP